MQQRDHLLVNIEVYLLSVDGINLLRLMIKVIVNLCFIFSGLGCGETLGAIKIVVDTIIKLLLGDTT